MWKFATVMSHEWWIGKGVYDFPHQDRCMCQSLCDDQSLRRFMWRYRYHLAPKLCIYCNRQITRHFTCNNVSCHQTFQTNEGKRSHERQHQSGHVRVKKYHSNPGPWPGRKFYTYVHTETCGTSNRAKHDQTDVLQCIHRCRGEGKCHQSKGVHPSHVDILLKWRVWLNFAGWKPK